MFVFVCGFSVAVEESELRKTMVTEEEDVADEGDLLDYSVLKNTEQAHLFVDQLGGMLL